jgi:Putative peptidoglycan binding domain
MSDFGSDAQSFGYGWGGLGIEGGGDDDGMSGLGRAIGMGWPGTTSASGVAADIAAAAAAAAAAATGGGGLPACGDPHSSNFVAGDKLDYQPSLGPVGSGAGYWPGDVRADALALDFLGCPIATAATPSTGTQSGDMSTLSGAWDPNFRGAVGAFQAKAGISADGWIGPSTRTVLAQAVATQNAAGGYGGGGAAPGPSPSGDATAPSNHGTLLALGAAALAAAGAWWYLR